MARRPADRPADKDAGLTLVELLAAMGIFTIVIVVFMGGLITMTRSTVRAQDVTDAGDAVRMAFQTMDKQIRYASAVNRPGVGPSGSHYVEFIATSLPDGQDPLCTQWRFDPTARTLAYRTWRDIPTGTPTAWRVIANDVRNDLTASPPDVPFAFDPAGSAGLTHQQLRVSVDVGRGVAGSTEVVGADVSTAFVARNSSYSSQSNSDTTPADGVSDHPICSSHLDRP